MHESNVTLTTADGQLDTFICHPEENGPHPAVIIYMDAPGIRDELRDMASRLATSGYYVMLPNLYYRIGTEGNCGYDLTRIREDEKHLTRMHECRQSLSNEMIVRDTRALLDYCRTDAAAGSGPLGCVGYCMSGSFVCAVASAYPDDFAAIASFYGVGIITDEADSPHLNATRIKARSYLAFASDDPWVPPSVLEQLPAVIEKSGWDARIEIYPDTGHGFAFVQRADYKRWAGERHWERILDLLGKSL
ncbi:MAG: dienelactone hydrolase family protein [Burkholderiaceae bacterium]